MKTNLARRTVAEGLRTAILTAILLASVVGSGIVAERTAGGNVAIALLANTIATGAALVTLILMFGGVSGAHFNAAARKMENVLQNCNHIKDSMPNGDSVCHLIETVGEFAK